MIYEFEKNEDEYRCYLLDKDDSMLCYELASDGIIYVSEDGRCTNTKNIDDLINELLSVKDEINRLRKEYGADKFLTMYKGYVDTLNDETYIIHDVPIHDYQTQRKDSIGE